MSLLGISGGDIGFDEGGVLEALSKPFYTKTVVTTEYNKQGLPEEVTTDTYSISMMHIVSAMVLGGSAALLAFSTKVWSDPETQAAVKQAMDTTMWKDDGSKELWQSALRRIIFKI